MLGKLGVENDQVILDPFSGAGTTAIESKLEGFKCYGFEINPLLHFVGSTSLDWSVSPEGVRRALKDVGREFRGAQKTVSPDQVEQEGYIIPPIHNVHRWWRKDVLRDLCILMACIDRTPTQNIKAFFRLAIAGVLVPDLTNVTLGKLQLHFIDRSKDEIDVWLSFEAHINKMLDDLKEVQALERVGTSHILHQDATDLRGLVLPEKVDHVITSPPYPNRYSYVWNTRPHLYLLGFITEASSASALDKRTIGGTWGTATSMLQKGIIEPINDAVREVVKPIADEIRVEDNLMANYAIHYFNRLTVQVMELDRIASPQLKLAYVLGNSWLKGVYVETDVLFANILERLELPYRVDEIHRFRRRHGGKDLFESIVYASR
jgi:hypothetical protein